jgi:hypothetical protein
MWAPSRSTIAARTALQIRTWLSVRHSLMAAKSPTQTAGKKWRSQASLTSE